MKAPRFPVVVVATAVASLLLVLLVAWRVDLLGREEENRDCQRSVEARVDNRTMWLYLVDTADSDPKRVEAFLVELNKRLPELVCHNGDPIPAK